MGNNVKAIYSLTPMQEGMLYHKMYNQDDRSYHVQDSFWVNDTIQIEFIKMTLDLLVCKHEVLKTAFVTAKSTGEPLQVIVENRKVEFKQIKITSENEQIAAIKQQDLERGFDLKNDSLLRLTVVTVSEKRHLFLFSHHHIIMDGSCITILYGDFMRYYTALTNGKSMSEMKKVMTLEKSQIASYEEYLVWLKKQDKEEGLNYWTKLLDEYNGIAQIKPTIKPVEVNEQIVDVKINLSKEVTQNIIKLATESNVTVNTVAEAAWGIVLQNYNYSKDVVFGKVVSGRNVPIKGIQETLGLFINTIPFRVKCESKMTVTDLLKALYKQGLEGNDYDYCSLAEIQKLTTQKEELIKTLFVFENFYLDEDVVNNSINKLQLKVESTRDQTNYPIAINFGLMENTLEISIMYNPNKYIKRQIISLLECVENVLEAFTNNPTTIVDEIEVISKQDKECILEEFNGTYSEYPRSKTVIELFEEQVAKVPEDIAVIYGERTLTYMQLNNKANAIGYKLRELGVGPDDFIAVIAERSIEMVVGIYGILKAGGAYVPIDPTYPDERIKYILQDSKPKGIITFEYQTEEESLENRINRLLNNNLPDGMLINLKNIEAEESKNLQGIAKPENLAYCIYTSGTTGNPKGVMIENHNLVNYLSYGKAHYKSMTNTMPLFSNIAFDLTVTSVFLPLISGGKISIYNEEIDRQIERIFRSDEIGIVKLTPIHMKMAEELTGIKELTNLQCLILGGEALTVENCKKLLECYGEHIKIHNEYGPTECTIGCCDHIYDKSYDQGSSVSIGRPIANTQIYIINNGKLCGIGISGELCIAGDGVARGYLNNTKLTSEKFTDNPYGKGKLYHSGDLARWLEDGTIEYLGRIDEQVKIRGYRIELGEIENALKKIEDIKDVAVIARVDSSLEKAIYAYIVADKTLSMSKIRKQLREVLPHYMIPTYMMQIGEIPITKNGKLNKDALPQIIENTEEEYVAPRTEREKVLCSIFEKVLNIEGVGIKAHFFELGGDSIKAIRIISRMRDKGYEITYKEIMNNYTIEEIAETLETVDERKDDQEEATGIVKATPIMKAFEEFQLKKPQHYNQAVMLNIGNSKENSVREVMDALVKQHDILRAVYRNKTLEILGNDMNPKYTLEVFDYTKQDAIAQVIENECTRIQGSIDLEHGPLTKVALFKTNTGNHLMLCIHHLSVDGVSWRILIEDFYVALKQVEEGKKVTLPVKTASYIQWANALEEYKVSKKLLAEKKYWQKVVAEAQDSRLDIVSNSIDSGFGNTEIKFSKDQTYNLLNKTSNAYTTEAMELMISALAMAINKLTGQTKVVINLEGHGREEIHKKIAIDRTVGWFTSIYPVVIGCYSEIEKSIISVKDILRGIPNKGMGYGVLKEELPPIVVDICFNYLGEMDAEFKDYEGSSYQTGKSVADENKTTGKIEVDGLVLNGELAFSIEYDKDKYIEAKVIRLGELYKQSLEEIIDFCISKEERVHTKSDYDVEELQESEFEEIMNLLN